MPTPLLVTGFEFGTMAGQITGTIGLRLFDDVSGAPSIVSGGRNGAYELRVNPSASTQYAGWLSTGVIGASKTVLVVSFAFKFSGALPTSDVIIAYLQNNAAADSALWFRNSDDKLMVLHNDTTGTAAVGPVIVADTWYHAQIRYNVAAATHTVEWEIDGVAQTQFNGGGTAGTLLAFAFGNMFGTATMDLRVDDVMFGTTSADYPFDDHKVVMLIPDTSATAALIAGATANSLARFTANATADTTFNSANVLAATSEVPPLIGATATGVCQRTAGAANAVEIPMTSYTLGAGETISGVRVVVCGWAGSATANNLSIRTFNGTTETTLLATSDPGFDNSTTAPAWYCKMATGADFNDQTQLNAMAIRLGYSTDIAPLPGAHAIYAEVAVKLSTGATPRPLQRRVYDRPRQRRRAVLT